MKGRALQAVTLIVVLVVAGAVGYLVYENRQLQDDVDELTSEISDLEWTIDNPSSDDGVSLPPWYGYSDRTPESGLTPSSDDCVNASSGAVMGCGEAGAVDRETYDEAMGG